MLTRDGVLQVRLSILCAYLFGKSALFVVLLRWAGHAGALLRAAAQPLASVLGCVPNAPCMRLTLPHTWGGFSTCVMKRGTLTPCSSLHPATCWRALGFAAKGAHATLGKNT